MHKFVKLSPIFYVSDTILSGSFLVVTGDGQRQWGLLREGHPWPLRKPWGETSSYNCSQWVGTVAVATIQDNWKSSKALWSTKVMERGSYQIFQGTSYWSERGSQKRLTQVLNDMGIRNSYLFCGESNFYIWDINSTLKLNCNGVE